MSGDASPEAVADANADAEADAEAEAEAAAKKEQKEATKALFWRQCVEDLFDGYAKTFDGHLQKVLQYDAPRIIREVLEKFQSKRLEKHSTPIPLSWSVAADIGAGTGLMGEQLRPHCFGKMIACDLSRKMLAVAKKKGIYDHIETADIVHFVKQIQPGGADLIVAADVLIYLNSLEPLFDVVQKALSPGGLFAYTTELCTLEEAGVPPDGIG
jgi:predicted TPR repeat methyltransferase